MASIVLNGGRATISYRNCHGVERRRETSRKAYERWNSFCGWMYTKAIKEKRSHRYVPCSGQGRGSKRWSVQDLLIASWRPRGATGNIILFSTRDAAIAAANKHNVAGGYPPIPHLNRGW
jgi:hypothetical protein